MSLKPASAPPSQAWSTAARLLVRWLEQHERVDALLESLPATLPRMDRSRIQSLLFGTVRHWGRIEAHLTPLLAKPPRARVRAVLLLAGCELIEGGPEGHVARVVHHAVEQTKTLASPSESRLVNAVVRKLAAALAAEVEPGPDASVTELARWYSHPRWMVERWWGAFGGVATRALLVWNQQPAPMHARWRADRKPTPAELTWLEPTEWEGFYGIKPGHWAEVSPLLGDGTLYVQDPSTRLAVGLLAPRAGESVLDVCAAPGGKSLAIADRMGTGKVVACDLPGPRIDRLKTNLALAPAGVEVSIVQTDLTQDVADVFKEHNLPDEYSAVLIDVPCSNTGVMRHRVDVKWRLQAGDFDKHSRQQLVLLTAAARFVAVRGRLVYSTCSLDAVENERVVEAFCRKSAGRFRLAEHCTRLPWVSGHDGAAAFLIERME